MEDVYCNKAKSPYQIPGYAEVVPGMAFETQTELKDVESKFLLDLANDMELMRIAHNFKQAQTTSDESIIKTIEAEVANYAEVVPGIPFETQTGLKDVESKFLLDLANDLELMGIPQSRKLAQTASDENNIIKTIEAEVVNYAEVEPGMPFEIETQTKVKDVESKFLLGLAYGYDLELMRIPQSRKRAQTAPDESVIIKTMEANEVAKNYAEVVPMAFETQTELKDVGSKFLMDLANELELMAIAQSRKRAQTAADENNTIKPIESEVVKKVEEMVEENSKSEIEKEIKKKPIEKNVQGSLNTPSQKKETAKSNKANVRKLPKLPNTMIAPTALSRAKMPLTPFTFNTINKKPFVVSTKPQPPVPVIKIKSGNKPMNPRPGTSPGMSLKPPIRKNIESKIAQGCRRIEFTKVKSTSSYRQINRENILLLQNPHSGKTEEFVPDPTPGFTSGPRISELNLSGGNNTTQGFGRKLHKSSAPPSPVRKQSICSVKSKKSLGYLDIHRQHQQHKQQKYVGKVFAHGPKEITTYLSSPSPAQIEESRIQSRDPTPSPSAAFSTIEATPRDEEKKIKRPSRKFLDIE